MHIAHDPPPPHPTSTATAFPSQPTPPSAGPHLPAQPHPVQASAAMAATTSLTYFGPARLDSHGASPRQPASPRAGPVVLPRAGHGGHRLPALLRRPWRLPLAANFAPRRHLYRASDPQQPHRAVLRGYAAHGCKTESDGIQLGGRGPLDSEG